MRQDEPSAYVGEKEMKKGTGESTEGGLHGKTLLELEANDKRQIEEAEDGIGPSRVGGLGPN